VVRNGQVNVDAVGQRHREGHLLITQDEIRDALDRDEMFVEYLPIVALVDRTIVGAEILARWRRGDRIVSSEELYPLVENTSLAGRLTYWLVERLAGELDHWLAENRDAHVTINVPPEIIGRGGLEYAAVRAGLRAHFDQIVIELRERGVPDRLALETLDKAAERGVRVALDGTMLTGANLALLSRANVSMIKLDHALTAELAPGKSPPGWLAGLQALLQHSDLEVVAEGVTTEFQATWLRAAGVQMAQGPFFSPPVDALALQELYARDHGARAR
jgi:EAL domain-containing protein (putative c-di-GMP-specific phosphodiesterase class I)